MTPEAFLARLYADETARTRFLADPEGEAREAGFDEDAVRELAAIDPDDLRLAARSFARKRAAKGMEPEARSQK